MNRCYELQKWLVVQFVTDIVFLRKIRFAWDIGVRHSSKRSFYEDFSDATFWAKQTNKYRFMIVTQASILIYTE